MTRSRSISPRNARDGSGKCPDSPDGGCRSPNGSTPTASRSARRRARRSARWALRRASSFTVRPQMTEDSVRERHATIVIPTLGIPHGIRGTLQSLFGRTCAAGAASGSTVVTVALVISPQCRVGTLALADAARASERSDSSDEDPCQTDQPSTALGGSPTGDEYGTRLAGGWRWGWLGPVGGTRLVAGGRRLSASV